MAEAARFAAVDLGGESGRVMVGRLQGDRVALELAHRFANRPLWLPDGLHWNLPAIFEDILTGLARAAAGGPLVSVGVDAWGCDYAWIDAAGRMLGLPYSYRDGRTTAQVIAAVHDRVAREELYRRTGIQTMAINTVFQMAAEARSAAMASAARLALVPDLVGLWLTGTLVNEVTAASTTGLLEATSHRWARDVVHALGFPSPPFAAEVVASGVPIGSVLPGHERAGAAVATPVVTSAGHDTASSFVAAPLGDEHAAVLSSGTWSLLGLELDGPELGAEAVEFNLTNERGVRGRTRLLRNVMGLWLVQECRRAWSRGGEAPSYAQLHDLARGAGPEVALFDPDDDSLLTAGADMPGRIVALCAPSGGTPRDCGELVRSILVSLACKYRLVLERLERVSGRRVDVIHVVGGGVRNELLCQLTADICRRVVRAGAVEATALGNVLVQALAAGEVADLEQARALAVRSAPARDYEPAGGALAQETYARFLSLPSVEPVPTAV